MHPNLPFSMPIKKVSRIFLITATLSIWQGAFGQNLTWRPHEIGISDRDLLNLGDPASRLDKVASNPAPGKSDVDTLRILAIRVDFQEDNNTLTTGNGKFDFVSSSEIPFDRPPHDLTYFENQLLALSNYYKTVSKSKLVLESDVYPKNASETYTVSQEMSAYSSPDSDEQLDQGLSLLFQEAFQLADASGGIDFSSYDSFVLFHAGVGRDFAFDFNETPLDIPSVFLDFGTLKENLEGNDPSFQGIAVNGGTFFIRDGLILPETQSQKGFAIGLLGTAALMFGSQLGLPVLFNTETGLAGIGVFGLMDQGSGNFSGLLPAEPSAWSKIFLGWETPIEIRNGEDLPVAAPHAANQNRIYKIPVDSKEYFLVENRFRDFNDDGVAIGRDADGKRVEFKWTQNGPEIAFEDQIGVITQVNEYDFGLPTLPSFPRSGSGILIWHIDERIIEANFATNRVNANPEHRGVDLEEADGAQDIGQVYGFLSAGAGSESGVIEDMFWGSNEINMLVNSSSAVAFTPFTTPGSLSNFGANPHIYITDFSEPDTVMVFSIRNEVTAPGFPQFIGASDVVTNSPVVADLNNDGKNEIILTSQTGTDIFVWNSDGSKFIQNQDAAQIENLNGIFNTVPLAVFATPPGTAAFSPAVAQVNDQRFVIVATDQAVAAYLPQDQNADGRADSLFVFKTSTWKFTTPPLVFNGSDRFQVVVGTESGDFVLINQGASTTVFSDIARAEIAGLAGLTARFAFTSKGGDIGFVEIDGTLIWRNQLNTSVAKAPVIGDLDQDGSLDVVSVSDDGEIHVFGETGRAAPGFPRATNLNITSQIALGDIDGDKFFEIVFAADNKVYAFNHTGSMENHFPIEIRSGVRETNQSSPILVDLDNDGRQEIIIGSPENQLIAFHNTRQLVAGFPLSTGRAVNSTPFATDLENDGDLDLAVASDDGFVYVWDLPNSVDFENVAWAGLFQDAEHSNVNLQNLQSDPPGGDLMPKNLVYNYPNPTEGNTTTIRYTLNFPAEVKIKIYDLAGELVDELEGTGFGQVENEVIWGLENIQSGVYLARVEANGDQSRDAAIIKIAVVK